LINRIYFCICDVSNTNVEQLQTSGQFFGTVIYRSHFSGKYRYRVLAMRQKLLYFDRPLKIKAITNMKILVESIRNFWEGFSSFYTSIYEEIKSWKN